LSIFPTNLGWFGLIGRENLLVSMTAGHVSAAAVRRAVDAKSVEDGSFDIAAEADWHPELRRRLEKYALGTRDDFTDVDLELPTTTDFQRRVLKATRRIGYGKTLTYGQLAAKAGFPRAARGVGTVMSSNCFPIVIPCHRVVAAGGKPGGYSSPQGVSLKLQLLEMEAGR
jgi:methylated-DNA-[protein]-cysteine S-methyltransferase